MGIFDTLLSAFHLSSTTMEGTTTIAAPDIQGLSDSLCSPSQVDSVNPATGLPLMGEGHGAIDIGGSPLGTDLHSPFHSGID